MKFVAIDVETANADLSSICQIGLVRYHGSEILEEYATYIDPQDDFDPINISIHGIDPNRVSNSPIFRDVTDKIYSFLDNELIVCHTHFDRASIFQTLDKHSLRKPSGTWLDTAMVARRAWEKFSKKGYGLSNVCRELGYEFNHHDALEDAKAAAYILLAAEKETDIEISQWPNRVRKPIVGGGLPISQPGNPEGGFYGETVVFTGSLEVPRRVAAEMAAKAGCNVRDSVTGKTTLLVVGDQDVRKLSGHDKSSKHRKAEKLITSGSNIRILSEQDFKKMILLSQSESSLADVA